MIEVICCVCKKKLGEKPGDGGPTHTYCIDCLWKTSYVVVLDMIEEKYWTGRSLRQSIQDIYRGDYAG